MFALLPAGPAGEEQGREGGGGRQERAFAGQLHHQGTQGVAQTGRGQDKREERGPGGGARGFV